MRRNIKFEVSIQSLGRLTGKGQCLLSSSRLVLINNEGGGGALKAFDVPLGLVFGEALVQPIFNANYIEGKVQPLDISSLQG